MKLEENKSLEKIIIIEDNYLLEDWNKILKDNEGYAKEIARDILKYIVGPKHIKLSYFGIKNGRMIQNLKEGYLFLEPANEGEKIFGICGIDNNISNLKVGRLWVSFTYNNKQDIMIGFDYADSKGLSLKKMIS